MYFFCCGMVSLCFLSSHFSSNSVQVAWKALLKLRICMLFSLRSVMVRVVGECRHAAFVMCASVVKPLYLAVMYFVIPLFMVPSQPWSFSASLSYSVIYFRYAVLEEKVSIPNSLCGSCVARFGVLLGTLHIALVSDMTYLSNFLMSGIDYETAWKLYSTPGLNTVFTVLFFVLLLLMRLITVCFG